MEISCCANGTGFPSKRYRKRSSPRGTLYVSHGHTLPCLCRCHGSSGLWSRLFALPPRTGRQGHRRLLRRPDWAASNAFCRIYTCFFTCCSRFFFASMHLGHAASLRLSAFLYRAFFWKNRFPFFSDVLLSAELSL